MILRSIDNECAASCESMDEYQLGSKLVLTSPRTHLEISVPAKKVDSSFVDTSRFPDICSSSESQREVSKLK